MKLSRLISGVFTCLPILMTIAVASAADDPIDVDVLLQGGTLFDGSGSPGVIGNVGLKGDRIVGVGQFKVGQVGRTIDCTGLYIVPGFIDLHNHSDSQVVDPILRACVNYITQGCTTLVTGNCGGGPIDVGEYYGKIDTGGAGTNVVHLLPQGALRESRNRQHRPQGDAGRTRADAGAGCESHARRRLGHVDGTDLRPQRVCRHA